MAKVKIKNLNKVISSIKDVFEDTTTQKKLLDDIGELVVKRIQFFARTKKSLEGNDKPTPLPNLKDSTVKRRKEIGRRFPQEVDDDFFLPNTKRSNVTLTGQLLRALSFLVKKNEIVVFFKSGRKKASFEEKRSTNDEVYDDLESRGFGFVGLDEKGQKQVKKLVLDEFRRTLRKRF